MDCNIISWILHLVVCSESDNVKNNILMMLAKAPFSEQFLDELHYIDKFMHGILLNSVNTSLLKFEKRYLPGCLRFV